jgi:hypothetical protein
MLENQSLRFVFFEDNEMFSDKLLSAGFAKQGGLLLVGLTLSAWAYTAGAVAIFDQSPLDSGVAYQSNWTGGSQYADNFSFNSEATLESIQWWGSYLTQGDDDFKVQIFSGVSGPEVNPVAEFSSPTVTRTSTSLSDSGKNAVFQYELSIQLTLQAGTYYLSVINNNDNSIVNNDNPSDWLWLQSSSGDQTAWFRQLDGESWVTDVVQGRAGFSFILNGTQQQQPIPEPGILSLLALGALVMGGRQLFQRRRAM